MYVFNTTPDARFELVDLDAADNEGVSMQLFEAAWAGDTFDEGATRASEMVTPAAKTNFNAFNIRIKARRQTV